MSPGDPLPQATIVLMDDTDNTQLCDVMHGVHKAHQVVDVAQAKYGEAVNKQAQTAAALTGVEKNMRSLRDKDAFVVGHISVISSESRTDIASETSESSSKAASLSWPI